MFGWHQLASGVVWRRRVHGVTFDMYKRGALIVLEGCDRAGKSTQVKMLINAMNDLRIPVKARAFPSESWQADRMS